MNIKLLYIAKYIKVMDKLDKYHRYQLTYPFEGSKIYKSRSRNNAIRKCYDEYIKSEKHISNEFRITDIDTRVEYKFMICFHDR
jgi:hypothetical protein